MSKLKDSCRYTFDVGHESVVRLLIENGGDMNIGDKLNRTALYFAVNNGNYCRNYLCYTKDVFCARDFQLSVNKNVEER